LRRFDAGTAVFLATTVLLLAAPVSGSAGARATLLIIAALALGVLWVREGLRFAVLPRAVWVAYGAWLLVAVASLAWTARPTYTLGELRSDIFYPTLALAVFSLAAARDPRLWAGWRAAVLAGTLIVFVISVAQPVLPFIASRHSIEGQAGLWSTYLVLVAPLVLTLAAPKPWGSGRGALLQVAAMLLLFGIAWRTGNRAIWVALGVQLLVVAALSHHLMPDVAGRRAQRGWGLLAVLFVAFALVASMKDRILAFNPGASIPAAVMQDERLEIWSFAASQYREAPFIGHGFGREIRAAEFARVAPQAPGHPPVEHAHNLFIDAALQLGVIGLVVLVALLASLAWTYRVMLRDPRLAALGVIGLALLAGFLAKNMTDNFLHRHIAVVFWALNGALLGLASAPRPERQPPAVS
jgi:O-antigen ligase